MTCPFDLGHYRELVETAKAGGYRFAFFDATPHAEFLYAAVKQTIEVDLPRETNFLSRYDRFRGRVAAIVDMPESTLDLLFRFLHQNDGALSKRSRELEFARLTDAETNAVEAAYREAFGGVQ